jgi:hypothetical protein
MDRTTDRTTDRTVDRAKSLIALAAFLLIGLGAVAQQSSTPPATSGSGAAADNVSTVRGCLNGQRGNYVVVEDKTGLMYVLKGVGNTLNGQLHRQVEVKGKILPGTIKTGINPAKAGSNPSDTARGVDGVPLQVANPETDIRTISKKCKAADQQ